MNWFLAFRFLRYYIFSKHKSGHGIHSPFVYSLIRDVFKNKTDKAIVNTVERLRKRYRSDQRIIAVEDLGSGSLRIKSNNRKVADIALYSSVRPLYGGLLSRLASRVDGKTIIELGTSLGIGTMYLALGAPRSEVITLEGCENTALIARESFIHNNISNIDVRCGNFDDLFKPALEEFKDIGLVYIDGNHKSEALLRYMNMLRPFIRDHTIVIVDDIHYSRDMEAGWEQLKVLDYIGLSVDLLQMGLLFFEKGISKQDFVIRY